jgi:hypothetical protein
MNRKTPWGKITFAFVFMAVTVFMSQDSKSRYDPNEYYYAKGFLGANNGAHWDDADEMGGGIGVGYVKRLNKTPWFVEARWEHVSQPLAGYPFNKKDESTLDHIGLSIEYRF